MHDQMNVKNKLPALLVIVKTFIQTTSVVNYSQSGQEQSSGFYITLQRNVYGLGGTIPPGLIKDQPSRLCVRFEKDRPIYLAGVIKHHWLKALISL